MLSHGNSNDDITDATMNNVVQNVSGVCSAVHITHHKFLLKLSQLLQLGVEFVGCIGDVVKTDSIDVRFMPL